MINVCENFADENDVTVNTKKKLCICYGSDDNATLRQVSLNGVKIPWQSTVKHLSNFLMYDVHDEADIYKKWGISEQPLLRLTQYPHGYMPNLG